MRHRGEIQGFCRKWEANPVCSNPLGIFQLYNDLTTSGIVFRYISWYKKAGRKGEKARKIRLHGPRFIILNECSERYNLAAK